MSDILLLNLPFTSLGYKSVESFASRSFPLGLGSLSGVLKKRGFRFAVLDADALGMGIERMLSEVAKAKPRIIGMSVYTPHISMVTYVVKEIKKISKDTFIVLGGHHAFAKRAELLNETESDVAAVGEGEYIFSDICESVLSNKSLDNVGGIYFRRAGSIVYTGDREYIKDLDSIPMPAYEYFPMEHYEGHFYRRWTSGYRKPFANLITSRGCPFSCGFCANVMWGRRVRYQSPERVIGEIDYLVRDYGIRQLSFFDDTFTLNMQRAHKICDLLIERDYGLDIYCSTRVDFVNEDLVKKMARAGFRWIGIGIESGNERVLKKISKSQSLKRCSQALQLIADNGIAIYGNVILGYPEEDKGTLHDTLSFMLKNPVHLPQFNIFVAYPGTPIYNELVSRGIEVPKEINQLGRTVSYNRGISARYLVLFQWYCYFRSFFRVRYLRLIKTTFHLPLVLSDLIGIGLAALRLDRRKNAKEVLT